MPKNRHYVKSYACFTTSIISFHGFFCLILYTIFYFLQDYSPFISVFLLRCLNLDELLESTVDGGSNVGDVLPEVDGEESALGDALGGELELL